MQWFRGDNADTVPRRNSGLRYIPSFNEFVGDMMDVGRELDQQPLREIPAEQAADGYQAPTASNKPTREDPWRSVFNPGRPHTKEMGKAMYDTVKDRKRAPSTWEYILQSERSKDTPLPAFEQLDKNNDGKVDADELKEHFSDDTVDTRQLMLEADTNKDGYIDRDEYQAVFVDIPSA